MQQYYSWVLLPALASLSLVQPLPGERQGQL